MGKIISKAENIRLVIFDIDGVLTNGGLQFEAEGREYKTFNSLDGHAIRMLLECGIQADWITEASGGAGAAREAIDLILHAQNLLEAKQDSYLQ